MTVKEEILSFLRTPLAFASQVSEDSKAVWLRGLTDFAQPQISEKGDLPLRPAQVQAWEQLAAHRVGLILGPPGTGKTYALSWMAVGYLQARLDAGLPCRILVSAFTLNAIGNVLEGIHAKAQRYMETPPPICFFGNPPSSGLPPGVEVLPLYGHDAHREISRKLGASVVIVGCSVWSLNRVLRRADGQGDDFTAPVFDLICIDEASQTVVSHGLMALAGLATDGRILVAGDDKQLPPVRPVQEQEIDGRRLGGSLYDFLKSAGIVELPFDETFRLNAPLSHFPETKFYPKRYRSADEVAQARLALRSNWQQGLESWERVALDPENPVCVLLHEGPTSGTANKFEANVAARLVKLLYSRMLPEHGDEQIANELFWEKRLAVVSPHRAQNAAIRTKLGNHITADSCVIETVDRIQGKERDAIIASYTVSDPEFALAEAEFIFSTERLNVTITRARTKLILIISRRLLDVVPPDEDVLDSAQTLREFVFDTHEIAAVAIDDGDGRRVPVSIRIRGFSPERASNTTEHSDEPETKPALTKELVEILEAIKRLALTNQYGSVIVSQLRKELYREPRFIELRTLVELGFLRLDRKQGPYGPFWTAKPIDPPIVPYAASESVVRVRLEEVVNATRSGRLAPFYTRVRDRFVWIDDTGVDVLLPILEKLTAEGLVRLEEKNGSVTVDWIEDIHAPVTLPPSPTEALTDRDFEVLNKLEDEEARRINFGVFEAWYSARELAEHTRLAPAIVSDALRRLDSHGYVLFDEDGRVRSRAGELAREARYVKQRFTVGDAHRRPFLTRGLKLVLKARDKPTRDQALSPAIDAISSAVGSDQTVRCVLAGVRDMLKQVWKRPEPYLAQFQVKALKSILGSWLGQNAADAFVITADTGTGKTEAACLPLIAGAACDVLNGTQGTRAVLVYPRIRLSANQAQRIANYLAVLGQIPGMPMMSLGIQNKDVPERFENLSIDQKELWSSAGGSLRFPFFECPSCAGGLTLSPGKGTRGLDALKCACGWSFPAWTGSKAALRERPPHFFICVTESLHQWLHDERYGQLFGDRTMAPPRAVLADEIHLYTHVHGAQVGHALQRLFARIAVNDNSERRSLAIGMSATLGKPTKVWSNLSGRTSVLEIKPEATERQPNPRGREYFYFVQPEVESRGKDIAGASTSIQTLMVLAHGMRRRRGSEGGYRGIVFLDSIDKLKRLHSDYGDAEEGKRLAALRTRLYDDPNRSQPRRQCCGDPVSCDDFRDGECWYFAATDTAQARANGVYQAGQHLSVARYPVFSGTTGRVEEMIRSSDIVFATSTLEVGYDDPDMALVYQHYAPRNLASFIQRKGRGGRGADDRPITAVTLSPYSPLDSWYFRRPERMLDQSNFEIPLNMNNFFVVRGQLLALLLDAIARYQHMTRQPGFRFEGGTVTLEPDVARIVDGMAIKIHGKDVFKRFNVKDPEGFFQEAIARCTEPLTPNDKIRDLRDKLSWVPKQLFATINLPELIVHYDNENGEKRTSAESIVLALESATPGNMTRRYGRDLLHWIPPRNGRAPWLPDEDYRRALGFTLPCMEKGGVKALLQELPSDARAKIGEDPHPTLCRPTALTLERAGRMFGGGWTSAWRLDQAARVIVPVQGQDAQSTKLHHKTKGSLQSAYVVQADEAFAEDIRAGVLPGFVSKLVSYLGTSTGTTTTGLTLGKIAWGSDSEVRMDDPNVDDASFSQVFIHPRSSKTLLHGYSVETEGVRFFVDSGLLSRFVTEAVSRGQDTSDGRWHRGQFLRFLIASNSPSAGLNSYEADQVSELIFTSAGHPELRPALLDIIRRWDSTRMRDLLLRTYDESLAHHPLLTRRRVEGLAASVGERAFQELFRKAMGSVRSDGDFSAYLRSVVIHSLAVRLKNAFVRFGRGDERQVVVHAKLPVFFGADAADVISIVENGSHGDGTTRTFLEHIKAFTKELQEGTLSDCPNASEDACLEKVFQSTDRHSEWRTLNPRSDADMERLRRELGIPESTQDVSFQGISRLLFSEETVGLERVALYDLFRDTTLVRRRLHESMGREPTQWELVSAAVRSAGDETGDVKTLNRLLHAYRSLEDSTQEESLGAEARLADQTYRMSARLCPDGCPACLHIGSDISSGIVAESLLSRNLLGQFVAMH
jgi:ATP-dependent helicase YprA (DUF1998 family)